MKTYTIEGHEVLILGAFVLWPAEVELDAALRARVIAELRRLLGK